MYLVPFYSYRRILAHHRERCQIMCVCWGAGRGCECILYVIAITGLSTSEKRPTF